jgi:hypothetical protein
MTSIPQHLQQGPARAPPQHLNLLRPRWLSSHINTLQQPHECQRCLLVRCLVHNAWQLLGPPRLRRSLQHCRGVVELQVSLVVSRAELESSGSTAGS